MGYDKAGNDTRMQEIHQHNGKLTESLDLTQLPDRMQELHRNNNKFTGEIDLTQLPHGIISLHLYTNQFTGEMDFTHPPHGMIYLYLENNQLSGSFAIKRLPPGIRHNNARGNNFNAVVVVGSETRANISLQDSGVTSVIDENGDEKVEGVCI